MSAELIPAGIGPGMVPTGFAEEVLERASAATPPELWNGATNCAALAQKWNGFPREKAEMKTAQMFCEVELGQHLGPRPGQGSRTDLADDNFSHARSLIPSERASELRRYFGHREMLVGLIREGKRSRSALLLAVDDAEAVEVDADEVDVRSGDFREVLGDIELGSVALVLTDPPYPVEYLPLWDELGRFSALTLAEGGSVVAYCGQSILPAALHHLSAHLRYWWTLALTHNFGSQNIPGKNVTVGWKPMVWFVRKHRATQVMMPDRFAGSSPRKTLPAGDTGDWAQGVDELAPIISALTAPGDLIVDPFAGSGSTGVAALRYGRRFVGATL